MCSRTPRACSKAITHAPHRGEDPPHVLRQRLPQGDDRHHTARRLRDARLGRARLPRLARPEDRSAGVRRRADPGRRTDRHPVPAGRGLAALPRPVLVVPGRQAAERRHVLQRQAVRAGRSQRQHRRHPGVPGLPVLAERPEAAAARLRGLRRRGSAAPAHRGPAGPGRVLRRRGLRRRRRGETPPSQRDSAGFRGVTR
ncbi:hypothetical protein CURTO8I2_70306 [Curtobacterium sp. 8I-2]|nr:hypothetical protein CURTO8I2_70306 [Curtobacterium sp. 8I-2]